MDYRLGRYQIVILDTHLLTPTTKMENLYRFVIQELFPKFEVNLHWYFNMFSFSTTRKKKLYSGNVSKAGMVIDKNNIRKLSGSLFLGEV